MMIDLFGRG